MKDIVRKIKGEIFCKEMIKNLFTEKILKELKRELKKSNSLFDEEDIYILAKKRGYKEYIEDEHFLDETNELEYINSLENKLATLKNKSGKVFLTTLELLEKAKEKREMFLKGA